MNKLGKLLLVGTMALGLAGCGGNDKPVTDNGDKKEPVTITIGISPDYAPYESKTKDGKIVGFDIDMVDLFEKYLTEEEGVEYNLEFKEMDFDNIVVQIQGSQVDLGVSGFTYDEKRKVEWSEPYLGSSQVAVVNKNSDIKTQEDLKDKKIAAQTGATGEKVAKDLTKDYVGMKSVQDIFTGLSSNQYDAVIVDSGVAKNYVNNGDFKLIDEVLLDEKNYIIAKEGNKEMIEKINKCIEKFIASEDYTKLCNEYGLTPLEK